MITILQRCLILFCFALVSCKIYQPAQQFHPIKATITPIPLLPHQRTVDVFLGNEKPVDSFYKVKMVEIRLAPWVSADALLMAIKNQAKAEGVDALLIDNLSLQTSTVQKIESETGGSQYKALSGLGLVYKKNMNFVDTILKKQHVQWWLDDNPAPKEFDMQFDWNGNNTSLKDGLIDQFFNEHILPYDVFENKYEASNIWRYSTDSNNNITAKQQIAALQTTTVIYEYLNLNHPHFATIKIMDATNRQRKQKLLLTYNQNGFLTEKRLTEKDKTIWTEQLTYGATGRLLQSERWAIKNNKQTSLFIIKNEFYTSSDLPKPIL